LKGHRLIRYHQRRRSRRRRGLSPGDSVDVGSVVEADAVDGATYYNGELLTSFLPCCI